MKQCTVCKEVKPKSEFNKHSKRKDGLQSLCKDCTRTRFKEYYAKNKDKQQRVVSERNKKHRRILREKVNEIKSQGCSICPETEFCTIDFHHRNEDEKFMEIANMVKGGYSWETTKSEIDKCIVVCSNCHRKIHAGIITEF